VERISRWRNSRRSWPLKMEAARDAANDPSFHK
jgi:hypothetical protein